MKISYLKKSKDYSSLSGAQIDLGEYYQNNGSFEEARGAYKEAAIVAYQVKDYINCYKAYRFLAELAIEQSNFL